MAVGQPAYPTPSGRFAIQDKQVNPVWSVPNSPWAGELQGTTVDGGSAANPLKARWMGIANGVGIHGTGEDYSIGTRRVARLHPHARAPTSSTCSSASRSGRPCSSSSARQRRPGRAGTGSGGFARVAATARRGDSVAELLGQDHARDRQPASRAITAPTPKVKAVMAAMSTGWPVTSTKP